MKVISESEEDIYITQNRFSRVVFPTSEVDEILGNAVGQFSDKNGRKKQVVVVNDAEVLARNNERIPL